MTEQKNHIAWIDVIRVVACFMVIVSHSCDPYVGAYGQRENEFFWGSIFGSSVRPCVPLFVMMSGVLLFPIKTDAFSFYKRRFTRILYPFLIWSVFYAIWPWLQQKETIAQAMKNIAGIPVNFKLDATDHLWYLYMIVGLYLFMPVLSAWVEKGDKKGQRFFLIVWGYTLFIPYIKQWFPQLQGECDWNIIGTTYYFTGFTGYLLLGHYLVKYNPVPARSAMWIGVLLYIVGSIITYTGFVHTTEVAGKPVEIAWWFTGPNVMMQTLGLFLVLKNVSIQSASLKRIATLTFGIYLAHYFIVRGIHPFIYSNITAMPAVKILITVCSASILAYILVYILSKLPGSKYFIG